MPEPMSSLQIQLLNVVKFGETSVHIEPFFGHSKSSKSARCQSTCFSCELGRSWVRWNFVEWFTALVGHRQHVVPTSTPELSFTTQTSRCCVPDSGAVIVVYLCCHSESELPWSLIS
ncbi:hypothetical protein R3P38DRAFT_2792358 [Favolaschia claudopus]|uniref:Uncharacterized protein n=1 Tax=Favolaschia claudopus TaxID=2862362 RepID=A0AAW0AF38_9AGAR